MRNAYVQQRLKSAANGDEKKLQNGQIKAGAVSTQRITSAFAQLQMQARFRQIRRIVLKFLFYFWDKITPHNKLQFLFQLLIMKYVCTKTLLPYSFYLAFIFPIAIAIHVRGNRNKRRNVVYEVRAENTANFHIPGCYQVFVLRKSKRSKIVRHLVQTRLYYGSYID